MCYVKTLYLFVIATSIVKCCWSFHHNGYIPSQPTFSISSSLFKTATTTTIKQHHHYMQQQSQLNARKTMTICEDPIVTNPNIELESTTMKDDACDMKFVHPFSMITAITTSVIPMISNAADVGSTTTTTNRLINLDSFKSGLTIENFQPVCSASDNVYRVLQQTIAATVGSDKFTEYGPLIAGGLLRIRLELCVVESFVSEAVVPFIRDNGISWILPLHETVETFLAGAIFALATTFILIGSTKLVTVLITYTDFVFGLPSRLFGGFIFDRAQGKPVTLDIGIGPFQSRVIGPPKDQEIPAVKVEEISPLGWIVLLLSGTVNYFGQFLRIIREVMEGIDSFVGRYLVLWASGYLIIKFVHFKIFPDFPDFL